FQAPQGAARDAVKFAIHVWYHHFDRAFPYQNESEIRDALREKIEEGAVRREDLFIVSSVLPPRLWSTFHERSLVREARQKTPAALRLDCLDLHLMHWPTGFKGARLLTPRSREELFPADGNGVVVPSDTDFLETWEAMEELVDAGMVKAIGVSNHKQVDRLPSKPGLRHKPANNQIESHPYLPQEELMKFCQPKGISVTAYCPPGAPNWPWSKPQDISLFDDPQIKEIALKNNKSPAQVLIQLQIQRNLRLIPKSATPRHIEENFKVRGCLTLAKEEMETFLAFKKRYGICALREYKNHKDYPFLED
ncbi:ALDR reductase, partial [Arenaria interpres]|nr:ALDR reductase [Arenaria interpres]